MYASTNALPVNAGRPLRNRLRSYIAAVRRRSFEKRSISRLRKLDDRQLSDIGLTRGDVLHGRPQSDLEAAF